MLHTIMLLGLGFLTASLIAFLLAPYFWRYAVHATKQHIRQTSPLTMGEIRADRDQLRAEHALQSRKLEIDRDKISADNKDLKIEIAQLKKKIREQSEDASAFDAEVKTKDDQITRISEERDRLKALLSSREQDLKKSHNETRKEKTLSVRASTALKTAGEEIKTFEAELKTLKKSLAHTQKQHQTSSHKLKTLEGHISRLNTCTSAVKNLNQDLMQYEKTFEKFLNTSFGTKKAFQDAQKKQIKTLAGLTALEKSVRRQWTIASQAEAGGRKIFAPLKLQIDYAKSTLNIMKKIVERSDYLRTGAQVKKRPAAKKAKAEPQSNEDLSKRIRSLQDKLSA